VEVFKHRGGHSQLVGYARVSRRDQSLEVQLEALKKAGCCRVYAEKVSGAAARRPAFLAMLETLRERDVVVVHSLDRLGRRLSEVVRTLDELREQQVHVRDLRSGVDTSSQHGRMFMQLFGVFAEMERDLIRERTREGLAQAKKAGRLGGRPSVLTPAKVDQIAFLRAKGHSLRVIAAQVQVGEASVRKALELREEKDPRQMRLEGT